MRNHLMLDDLGKMTDAERSAIGPEELLCLQQELAEEQARFEIHKNDLFRAFQARYADTCEGEREKDTGVVHVRDGDYRITQDVKKNVRWDQKKLQPVLDDIIASGEALSDYVETTYKVPERKWAVWPQRIRDEFMAARNESPSRPSYSIGVSPR